MPLEWLTFLFFFAFWSVFFLFLYYHPETQERIQKYHKQAAMLKDIQRLARSTVYHLNEKVDSLERETEHVKIYFPIEGDKGSERRDNSASST